MPVRIMPRLDIKGPNLVKGIHLEGLRVLGKPEQFARRYYEEGADELVYMDVVASLYGRNSLLDIVERTSKEIFIPLTVGGGIRTLEDIRVILCAGADKVSINTAAIGDPEFVRRASRRFGSSTIVVSIEAIRKPDGGYEAYTDNGRERTGVDAFEWALRAIELGAGELLVTSIDREGTGLGFDLALTRMIAEAVPVPVIACGGAGTVDHVSEVLLRGKADAVSLASILHYGVLERARDVGAYSSEGNTEYLRGQRRGPGGLSTMSKIKTATLDDLKGHLLSCGIECRPASDGVQYV